MKIKLLLVVLILISIKTNSQVIINDFNVNNSVMNTQGLGRTGAAMHSSGSFAVAWQDFNDYGAPINELPRIAVQLFNNNGTPIGQPNYFQGEDRPLSFWLSDFLDEYFDLAFMPDGTLLVIVEHEGRLVIGGDDIWSAEVGIGAVSPSGQIIDLSNENGVIRWFISTETKYQENPRIAVFPTGEFVLSMNGESYNTNKQAVLIQAFDSQINLNGQVFTPHFNDPGPQANHLIADVSTNGNLSIVVWQDGRLDGNYDISGQLYNNNGPINGNFKINQGDSPGVFNLLPSVCMNSSGNIIVVWADTRTNPRGEIFGQLFNSNGQPVGNNFQISLGSGAIMDRPEVAMLEDGSFMVVWTDSISGLSGSEAYRAFGRQYSGNGTPLSSQFIIPNVNTASGLVNIGTNGQHYILSWLDNRQGGQNFNVYSKIIGSLPTSLDLQVSSQPIEYELAQNYPNPFNPVTTINYSIPQRSNVVLKVYDILGNEVVTLVNQEKEQGFYTIDFNANNLASGLYLYRIQAGSFIETKKMILLK